MSLLAVEGLSKTFGGVAAVSELDCTIAAGKIHSIIGPNGAGKTTLFNLINGVTAPTAGRIRFAGEDVTQATTAERARRGIARTFQNPQIFFNMTALENVMVGRHRHGDTRFLPCFLGLPASRRATRDARDKAAQLMDMVGLAAWRDAAADAMPYGALKRLEIARALAAEPKLLLLDEPAAGLNPKETQAIDALIQRIAADGVTVILVEHDMKLVMGVSDHILVLDHGRKLAEGTAAEVRHNPEVIKAYLGAAAP
jgi:branched-chain amino acid transport system ATP-binding protein